MMARVQLERAGCLLRRWLGKHRLLLLAPALHSDRHPGRIYGHGRGRMGRSALDNDPSTSYRPHNPHKRSFYTSFPKETTRKRSWRQNLVSGRLFRVCRSFSGSLRPVVASRKQIIIQKHTTAGAELSTHSPHSSASSLLRPCVVCSWIKYSNILTISSAGRHGFNLTPGHESYVRRSRFPGCTLRLDHGHTAKSHSKSTIRLLSAIISDVPPRLTKPQLVICTSWGTETSVTVTTLSTKTACAYVAISCSEQIANDWHSTGSASCTIARCIRSGL